jgi:hypothetical protein
VVPTRSEVSSAALKERVFLKDLAKYLHHRIGVLRKFGKKEGLIRRAGLGTAHDPAEYVSAYGAMRIIAYVRAIQGDNYLHGRQFHEQNEHESEQHLRRVRERAALGKESVAPSVGSCILVGRDRK